MSQKVFICNTSALQNAEKILMTMNVLKFQQRGFRKSELLLVNLQRISTGCFRNKTYRGLEEVLGYIRGIILKGIKWILVNKQIFSETNQNFPFFLTDPVCLCIGECICTRMRTWMIRKWFIANRWFRLWKLISFWGQSRQWFA